MPDEIVKTANAFRKALLARERRAAIRLVTAYGYAWARIERELAKLTGQIAEAKRNGEVVNQFWLLRQERYFALLGQVGQEMRKFEGVVENVVTKQQAAAVAAGLSDSVAVMEAGVSTTFNRLPVAAVENLVGTLGNG